MKVLILGVDGYLGWPTAMYLAEKGHTVWGVDSYFKRNIELACKVTPLELIPPMHSRINGFKNATGKSIEFVQHDITHGLRVEIPRWKPDVIIHYAEQPSAPYSMKDPAACILTQQNNVIGTLQLLWAVKDMGIHIVKLGTMGEYGTPNIDIEEGWLNINHNGREERILFPKQPGSWYHASKVHDSANIEFACRTWNIPATDLNQGVVYGCHTEETGYPGCHTSFHYDQYFGTALNRFIVQAVAGVPLTVYGTGQQTRGWLNILDTLRCVELACLNPARPGEFRVFNQFTEQFSVLELAEKVARITGADIQHLDNPRTVEKETHYYNARHTALIDLGLDPVMLTDDVLYEMVAYVEERSEHIDKSQILPTVRWK